MDIYFFFLESVHNEVHTSCLIDSAKLKPRQQNEGRLSLDATNTQHLRPLSTLNTCVMVNNHCHKPSYLTPYLNLELDIIKCMSSSNRVQQ